MSSRYLLTLQACHFNRGFLLSLYIICLILDQDYLMEAAITVAFHQSIYLAHSGKLEFHFIVCIPSLKLSNDDCSTISKVVRDNLLSCCIQSNTLLIFSSLLDYYWMAISDWKTVNSLFLDCIKTLDIGWAGLEMMTSSKRLHFTPPFIVPNSTKCCQIVHIKLKQLLVYLRLTKSTMTY